MSLCCVLPFFSYRVMCLLWRTHCKCTINTRHLCAGPGTQVPSCTLMVLEKGEMLPGNQWYVSLYVSLSIAF